MHLNKLLFLYVCLCSFIPASAQLPIYHRPGAFSEYNNERRNILTANFFLGGLGGGAGCGIEYQYVFGERHLFSVHVPILIASTSDQYFDVPGEGDRYHYFRSWIFAPGLRYHPFSATHRVDFAVGAQLAFGPTQTTQRFHQRYVIEETTFSTFTLAPMLDMSLSIVANRGFTAGLFASAGVSVSGDYGLDRRGDPIRNFPMLLLGVKLGRNF